jgi:phasin family protein
MNVVFQSDDLLDLHKSNASTVLALDGEILLGFQRLAELNLQVGCAILVESSESLQQMSPGTSRTDWLAFPFHFVQSAGEKALSYQRHIGDIAAATQSGCSNIATARHEQFCCDVQSYIEHWLRRAPGGAEVVAMGLKQRYRQLAAHRE